HKKTTRIEVANKPGKPEQDFFFGSLETSYLDSRDEFPTRCTLLASRDPEALAEKFQDNPDSQEWLLPMVGGVQDRRGAARLRALDMYFWTLEDAMRFYEGLKTALHSLQVNFEPLDTQLREERVSPAVEKLEGLAISYPPSPLERATSSHYEASTRPSTRTQRDARPGTSSHHPSRRNSPPIHAGKTPVVYDPGAPPATEPYHTHDMGIPPPPLGSAFQEHVHPPSGSRMVPSYPSQGDRGSYPWVTSNAALNPRYHSGSPFAAATMSPPPPSMVQDMGSPFSMGASPPTPSGAHMYPRADEFTHVSLPPQDVRSKFHKAPTFDGMEYHVHPSRTSQPLSRHSTDVVDPAHPYFSSGVPLPAQYARAFSGRPAVVPVSPTSPGLSYTQMARRQSMGIGPSMYDVHHQIYQPDSLIQAREDSDGSKKDKKDPKATKQKKKRRSIGGTIDKMLNKIDRIY
ncbi:hypothetical protein KEM55_006727, partial [Ascosphaera atra]